MGPCSTPNASSEIQCAPGANAPHGCPSTAPLCVGFENNVHWGHCERCTCKNYNWLPVFTPWVSKASASKGHACYITITRMYFQVHFHVHVPFWGFRPPAPSVLGLFEFLFLSAHASVSHAQHDLSCMCIAKHACCHSVAKHVRAFFIQQPCSFGSRASLPSLASRPQAATPPLSATRPACLCQTAGRRASRTQSSLSGPSSFATGSNLAAQWPVAAAVVTPPYLSSRARPPLLHLPTVAKRKIRSLGRTLPLTVGRARLLHTNQLVGAF